jgi:hypothetical protein
MWQGGSMGSHGGVNPWMKLMGIVHKGPRGDVQQSTQSASNDRALNM